MVGSIPFRFQLQFVAVRSVLAAPRRLVLRLGRRLMVPGLSSLLLVGCGATPGPPGLRPGGSPPLKVMASVLPVALFTRAVAAGCAQVDSLVPANLGPHDWQATPADLARLSQADVLVINGLGLESHLDKLVDASGNAGLRQIDSSRGVTTIANPAAAPGEAHDHDHDHDHASQHGPVNPHIWLDPRRAAQQVVTIREGLIAADPACRSRYQANAAAFLTQLDQLDRDLAGQFAPHAGRPLLAFHAIGPYFAQRYQLLNEALVDDPDQAPSAADLERFSRRASQSGARALVSEPQASSKAFVALATDLGLPLVSFDPLETAPADPSLAAAYYLSTRRRYGQQLLQALGR
jgi:zinc/manganese transport system substrate-binding protein